MSINGQLLAIDRPHLSALDRGFLLGDGLFETMRVRQGRILRWNRHVARLRAGAVILDLPIHWRDDDLEDTVRRTLIAGGLTEAVVRLTISRGVAPARGLLPTPHPSPTLVIHAAPFDGYSAELYARGMRAIVSTFPRNERSPLASVKSLNYLDNILARQEAARRGADEALLLNTIGNFAGASAANLFVVTADRILTPTRECGALPGTVRHALIECLTDRVAERSVSLSDLATAQEAFLTNALLEVVPLTIVDDRPVGTGVPGPVTLELADLLAHR